MQGLIFGRLVEPSFKNKLLVLGDHLGFQALPHRCLAKTSSTACPNTQPAGVQNTVDSVLRLNEIIYKVPRSSCVRLFPGRLE